GEMAATRSGREPAGTPPGKFLPVREAPLILVVDDQSPARELLVSYLEPEGYRTETADSAAEAIEKAKALRPDAITLDILMPNANGFEILVSLKQAPETANIPIIVVSIVDQQKVGFALGAADYMVKPVDKTVLLNTIRKHTQPQRNRDCTILLVDDDAATLELLDTTIRSAGYRTHTAASGKSALALLAGTRVDGMLLDLLMPEMDGFEVLRQVKQDVRLKDIPIFILTAKSLSESDLAALRRETRALFYKDGPWREELMEALARVVAEGRPQSMAGSA
ncbi:MAG: response regulator, partial [Candidatus Angelobacter sp.]